MKYVLSFLLMFSVATVSAQQYQVVTDHLPAYYSYGDEQHAFAVDSSIDFSDYTVYYCFTTIRDTLSGGGGGYCLDAHGGEIMGRALIQSASKTSIINYRGDSIHYFQQTVPQESHVFYTYPDGNYLLATHFQNQYEEVLGEMDSVKYFRLQAFTISGDSIESYFNGETFKLSRQYGLLSTFDNYLIPLSLYKFELSGFSNPVTGVHGMDWQDAFNINIGDEFHIRERKDQWFYDEEDSVIYNVSFITDKIRNIIGKEDYPDSIQFAYQECWRIIVYKPTGNDTTFITDTLIDETFEKYSTPYWLDLSWLDLYPGQFFKGGPQSYSGIRQKNSLTYNSRAQKFITREEIWGDSCLDNSIICPEHAKDYYIEGCGGPFYVYPGFGQENRRELRYFKKGSEEWGTPLARDCEDLLSSTDEHLPTQIAPLVYPNPFSGRLTVSSGDGAIEQLSIYNLNGSLQTSFYAGSRTVVANTSLLPAGIYLLEIRMADGSVFRKKLIKK